MARGIEMRDLARGIGAILRELVVPKSAYDYHPVAQIRTNVIESPASFFVKHTHSWSYEIGLVAQHRFPMVLPDNWQEPTFRLTATWDDKLQREWHLVGRYLPWWGEKDAGFSLVRYSVPDDIPKNQKVQFELSVVVPSSQFFEFSAADGVYCCRFSDK